MTYIAQCLNSYISVKIDYIPLLRTCGGWASQNNHSSVKKKEPRRRVYWQVQQIMRNTPAVFTPYLWCSVITAITQVMKTQRDSFSVFSMLSCAMFVVFLCSSSVCSSVSFGYLPLSKNTLGLLVILNWGMWLLFTPCQLSILVYKALWIPVIHNSNASLLVINDDFSGSRTDLIACSSNHSKALFCPRRFDYWWNYRQVQIEGNTIIKRLIKVLGYQMSHIIFNADTRGILQSTSQSSYNAEIEAPKKQAYWEYRPPAFQCVEVLNTSVQNLSWVFM